MTTSPDCTTIAKEIVYNRANRDYDCFLIIDGEHNLVGSAATYYAGEKLCNDEYYKVLEDNQVDPETQYAPVESIGKFYQCDDTDDNLSVASVDTDTPPVTVTVTVHDDDWTEYVCGNVDLHIEAGGIGLGIEQNPIIEWCLPGELPTETFRHLETLLQYPVVRERLGLQPAAPPAPPVTVTERESWTDYACGDALLSVCQHVICFMLDGTIVDWKTPRGLVIMDELRTLLNSPALVQRLAGLATDSPAPFSAPEATQPIPEVR